MRLLNSSRMRLMLVVFVAAIGLGGRTVNADFTFGEPTNLGPTINSPDSDFSGSFFSDGLEMYLDSNRIGGSWDTYDIYVSTRATTDDAWGTPVQLGPPVNSSTTDAAAIISTDGLSLYFTSLNRAGGYGSLDSWVATRATVSDPWGEPSNLGPTINTSQDDIATSISCDGLVLYFQRKPPPQGPGYIYMSTRPTTNDAWGEPVNLGPTVSSSYNDGSACISADGLLLFFSSNRPGGFGDSDLYMTRRATIDDDWGTPVNLGPGINTSAYDAAATILPDGSTLYFASDRPGGVGGEDIWQAPIFPVVDFNGDGKVDGAEVGAMADYWETDDSVYDIGPMPWGDGIVDIEDVEVLAEYIGKDVIDPTCIAHWALDETEGEITHDRAGDNHGTVMGAALWRPNTGMIAGALEFDGATSVVADCVLDPSEDPFSVLAWVNGGAPGQVVISQVDGANWLGSDLTNGCLMTELKGAGRDSRTLCSDTIVTDGSWHRITLVCNGDARSLYVDDILAAQDTQAGGSAGCSGGLNIGCDKDMAPGSFFSGLIDDVRIYNRAVRP